MARELFKKCRLTGDVNVTCKFEDGTVRIWQARKEEVIQHIVDIVEQYRRLGHKLTLRQLHYQLVKSNWIINHDTAYKKLGNILDDCRYGGIIDWDAIEDRGRKPSLPYYADSIADALSDIASIFRLDRQKDQDNSVEVWTEKDALSAILQRVTSKYHIQLVVNKGYTSSSAAHESYKRIRRKIENGQTVTILYFGDHDPSGLDMVRDIRERLYFFFSNGDDPIDYIEHKLTVKHIGLTKAQIRQYRLPPNPTKMTDTRSDGYIAIHGKQCWEVDALDLTDLTAIVTREIESQINMDLYNDMMDREREAKDKLSAFIDTNRSEDDNDPDADEED